MIKTYGCFYGKAVTVAIRITACTPKTAESPLCRKSGIARWTAATSVLGPGAGIDRRRNRARQVPEAEAVGRDVGCLRWHAAAMIVGECFTGFFAVWIVHRGCDEHSIARTQRGWLKNVVSYSMFYHLEHHLFPAVPTCKLSHLAARIEAVAPELRRREVV